MPLVQQLHTDLPSPIGQATETMKQHVSASKARARRRWVIRTTVTLTLTAALLFLFVTWRRDQMTIESSLRKFNDPVKVLQNKVDTLKTLPALLPELKEPMGAYYASDAERQYAMHTTEPTIIAVGKPIHLILLKDGQCVIIYHQGKVSSKWMPTAEFYHDWRIQEQKLTAFEKELFSKPPVLP